MQRNRYVYLLDTIEFLWSLFISNDGLFTTSSLSFQSSVDGNENNCTNDVPNESNIDQLIENVENAIKSNLFQEKIEIDDEKFNSPEESALIERDTNNDTKETISLPSNEGNLSISNALSMIKPDVATSSFDIAVEKCSNILNICTDAENKTAPTVNVNELNISTSKHTAKPIIIEVLSDADSCKPDESTHSNESRKTDDMIEVVEQSTDNCTAAPHNSGGKIFQKNSITFYCEKLDCDISDTSKEIDSETDCSIEEI